MENFSGTRGNLELVEGQAGGSGQSHKVLAKERSVRIKGLGPQAKDQEGVLQQLLEKIVPIKRVEILADEGEAVVELESVAVCIVLIVIGD